jgi:uncharacterized PurR-regulated membrane protein YhhQ (DUF165 family)
VILVVILAAGALDFLANWLAAHALIPVGPLLVPAGTLSFAAAFVLYDLLRRRGGVLPTGAAMVLGLGASLAYATIFGGGVGRIALAGLVALACSSSADLATQTVTLRWPLLRYVAVSNAVSLALDSLVFAALAFPGNPHLGAIIAGQYVGKLAMTALALPVLAASRRRWPTPAYRMSVA